MAELTAPPADAIDVNEASVLLGIHADGVRKIRDRGDLPSFFRDDSVYPAKYWYSRAEVEALASARKTDGLQKEDQFTPMEITFMSALRSLGGVVESPKTGRASGIITQRTPYRSLNNASRMLQRRGLIETDVQGKRTYRIALTPKGEAWCNEHLAEVQQAEVQQEAPKPPKKKSAARKATAKARAATTVTATVADRPVATNNHTVTVLPELLQSVEVYALAANDDGSFTMGLRDGDRRWITTITGAME